MEHTLARIGYVFYKKFGLTPNGLSYIRFFAAPWVALLVVESVRTAHLYWVLAAIVLYSLVVFTDAVDGPLARYLRTLPDAPDDTGFGAVLDRISDKLLIIFALIPFGFNVFIIAILIGESILAYQALLAESVGKKKATHIGKIKMLLQTFLIPLMLVGLLYPHTGFQSAVLIYMIVTAVFTYLSVFSHFRKST